LAIIMDREGIEMNQLNAFEAAKAGARSTVQALKTQSDIITAHIQKAQKMHAAIMADMEIAMKFEDMVRRQAAETALRDTAEQQAKKNPVNDDDLELKIGEAVDEIAAQANAANGARALVTVGSASAPALAQG
jgi:hypothetical protein